MQDTLTKSLRDSFPDAEILENEPMSRHTTFRTGGAASVFMTVSDTSALQNAVHFLTEHDVPYFIIGNGSNILVGDKGFDGVIVHPAGSFCRVTVDGNMIEAGAGALLSEVSAAAVRSSLTGLEFASGIPGTVGGAVRMNAGAYDGEMKQVIRNVTLMRPDGTVIVSEGVDMGFGYRTSIVCSEKLTVMSALMQLKPGDAKDIRSRIDEFGSRRREKQPLEYPSAGSTFKRPEGYFAGKLISDAGLKGYSVGGAQVSEKHAGFVINKGGATATDIKKLIEDVQAKVYETSGVKLEREVMFVGNF